MRDFWLASRGCFLAVLTATVMVGDCNGAEPGPSPDAVRVALLKSLPLLERSAKASATERPNCFTCHNQGLPIMALSTARSRGFAVDDVLLQDQLRFTADFLAKNRDSYREGRGQAGQTFMAGYALWALQHGEWPADDTTAAVAEYFLKYQADDDHWKCHTHRPPSEASHFTANFLGLMSLHAYSTAEQRDRMQTRREQVRNWLIRTKPADTEDDVFRLWGLRFAEAAVEEIAQATNDLLSLQRPDGGWAQTTERTSDAYATGTALVALLRAGQLATQDARCQRGLAYLLQSQQEDGSWHVVTRSEPFQTYYESGYPHGEDQYLSITAGGWATLALALTLPEVPPPPLLPAP